MKSNMQFTIKTPQQVFYAAINQKWEIVKKALKRQRFREAILNINDVINNQTLLDIACAQDNIEIIYYLHSEYKAQSANSYAPFNFIEYVFSAAKRDLWDKVVYQALILAKDSRPSLRSAVNARGESLMDIAGKSVKSDDVCFVLEMSWGMKCIKANGHSPIPFSIPPLRRSPPAIDLTETNQINKLARNLAEIAITEWASDQQEDFALTYLPSTSLPEGTSAKEEMEKNVLPKKINRIKMKSNSSSLDK